MFRVPGKWNVAAVALMGVCVSSGCVTVNRDTRVERGPVLRSFDREETIGRGGVHTQVEVDWPTATLTFARYDLCRKQRVEEVVEERITEQFAPAAAPSFSFGVSATTVGGTLMALRPVFSDTPAPAVVPGQPEGPSARQVATTWSWVLLATGVPALIVGVVGLAASGEQVQQTRIEQVASSVEHACNLRPADGTVTLWPVQSGDAAPLSLVTSGARVVLSPETVTSFRAATIGFDGEPAWVPEEAGAALESWFACQEITFDAEASDALPESELVSRYNLARQCETVAPEVGGARAKRLAELIRQRREAPEAPAP